MKKKEYETLRAQAFFDLVNPLFRSYFFNPYTLIECCAGNGNAGRIFSLDDKVNNVFFVDIKKVRGLNDNIHNLTKSYEIFLEGIDRFFIADNSAIIAVHACGNLTDRILSKSIESRVPVAVMSCCHSDKIENHNLKHPPDSRILLYGKSEDYYDAVRQQFLIENGYDAVVLQIDPKITPKNNVIIGVPNQL